MRNLLVAAIACLSVTAIDWAANYARRRRRATLIPVATQMNHIINPQHPS